MTHCSALDGKRSQRGVAAVEFALIASVFLIALLGAVEMARLLYIWNTAVEATRLGARMAVVCDVSGATTTAIRTQMKALVPQLADPDISVSYQPSSSCTAVTCTSATVQITASSAITTYIPFVSISATLPAFTTTLPRESMASNIGGSANPMCN